MEFKRRVSSEVRIGATTIGGENPVAVQSMTNTATDEIAASVAQIAALAAVDCPIVRLTAQGKKEGKALEAIVAEVRAKGLDTAIVADIHFTPEVAFIAAKYVDKVRINPGNFSLENRNLEHLIELCRERGVALRIGVNHGSLASHIIDKHGDTPEGMVASAMEFLEVCRTQEFDQVVISMKSSNTRVMISAYRLLAKTLEQNQMRYPIHLGVTEAGNAIEGRIKSAVGIGALLSEGIGDTIRVSLTEKPTAEIPVAKRIVDHFAKWEKNTTISIENRTIKCRYEGKNSEEVAIIAAAELGGLCLDGLADDIKIDAPNIDPAMVEKIELCILQAARVRQTQTEYIACPSCGRTLFDIEKTLEVIKERTSHLKHLKIGVMGCIVNGPGEMADADYGYVGAARGKITLYKKREVVEKNIPQEEALERLIEVIKINGDWRDE
ncbi:MAG: (E)-4-hydroxy-3-methylbut-2-enyl-diphosphate synthase [Rikenellaceae bacterium]